MATVDLVNVRKSFKSTLAVDRIELTIGDGEFFSLLGPSGCGKTTTLRMIAGFVRPTDGRILIGGEDVTTVPPEKREIGIVFQNYAIFPHMNVANNVAYGLKIRKVSKSEIRERVKKTLATVGLAGYEERFQRELSGGEQQRVALARVLVIEPRILLLDEPLSALDRKLREEMKYWIQGLQQSLGITTIYVTHDQNEALTMSDRIAVMNNGLVEQVGTPQEIYEHPRSRFVTDFIGDSNILDGEIVSFDDDTAVIQFSDCEIRSPRSRVVSIGEQVSVVIRPESVAIDTAPTVHANQTRGKVRNESFQGALIRHAVDVGNQEIIVESQNSSERKPVRIGDEVSLSWPVAATSMLAD